MTDKESGTAEKHQVEPLGKWPRVVCGFVGSGALIGGATAVFLSKNSLGTAVLLVIGALFFFMGLTGIPIDRAELLGGKVVMAQVARRLMESPNPEVREEAASIVMDSALPATNPIKRQAQALSLGFLYVDRVIEALARVSGSGNVHLSKDDLRVDAIVRSGQRRIGVEVKLITHSGSATVNQSINQALFMLSGNSGRDLDGILIVVNRSSDALEAIIQQHDRLRLLVWNSPSDDDDLKNALLDMSRRLR